MDPVVIHLEGPEIGLQHRGAILGIEPQEDLATVEEAMECPRQRTNPRGHLIAVHLPDYD